MKIHNYSIPLRKMKTQTTYPINRLPKFLLALSLFFSVFTFSGYAGNSESQQPQTTKTELVFSHNFKINKRIISYKKGITLSSEYNSFNKSKEFEKQALSVYNKLTKVKIDSNSILLYSFEPALRFFQLKTIPQNPTTEFSSAMA
ncbi:MAG: hypothetical protein V4547_19120 [Bacteroidota bacterium]